MVTKVLSEALLQLVSREEVAGSPGSAYSHGDADENACCTTSGTECRLKVTLSALKGSGSRTCDRHLVTPHSSAWLASNEVGTGSDSG
jgi:hypothetical protein